MAFDWSQSPNVSPSSAASSGVGAGLVGAGAGLAETYIQYQLNKKESQRAFDRQRQLMREEYDYNQQAQRNAAKNARAGLEAAGISPAVLAEGGFSAAGASAGGVSPASVSAPRLRPDPVTAQNANVAGQVSLMSEQIKDIQSSIALKDAQKQNVDAETRGKEIENNRMVDADLAAAENMRGHLVRMRDSLLKAGEDVGWLDDRIKAIDSGDRNYTFGAVEANELFERYRKENVENFPRYNQSIFDSKVAELMANNPEIAKAQASMPAAERDKIDSEISKLYSDVYNAQTNGALNAAKISEINTRIKQIAQDMKSAYLRDPRLMLSEEDYAHFVSYLGMDVYERGMEILGGLIDRKAASSAAESLETLKQAGQAELESKRQEGANARESMKQNPKHETETITNNPDGSVTRSKTTTRDNPYKPDYEQPRKRSRKRGKK